MVHLKVLISKKTKLDIPKAGFGGRDSCTQKLSKG